jgi:hypothetical protein
VADVVDAPPGSNVVVVGIVKDISSTIQKDYENLKAALNRFTDIQWFLVESNSTDASKAALAKISEFDPSFRFTSVQEENLNQSRFPAMARARNVYLEELRHNPAYSNCGYVVVADFNNLNNLINAEAIESCFKRDDWDVCCANQDGPYYDIWALRHDLWSPNDCWQELDFLRKHISYPERSLYLAIHSRMIKIPKNSEWIEVDSAFGGLAIYKGEVFTISDYSAYDESGKITCEHVPFHKGLRQKNKKIFINPSLINTRYTDHNSQTKVTRKILRHLQYPIKYLRKLNGR